MQFRDLAIGQEFDWIGGEYPSFFLRCVKISERKYRDEKGTIHSVGSVAASVYNVTPLQK